MTPDLEFARWLSRRLVERGISQRQLAQRSGVHHSSISRLMRGHHQPTHRTARRLTEVLDRPWSGPAELAASSGAIRTSARAISSGSSPSTD